MEELQQMFQRQRKYMFYLLSLYTLGWGFTQYKTIFLSLILGTTISFYGLWILARKTNRFGQAVIEGKKVSSLGTFSRMAAAGLAVLIVMRYPQDFSMIPMVLGLMTSYFVIIIDYFLQKIRKSGGKRGEY
ncbi:ATP synthase protein I [Anoxybacillus calidus]|jgi:ATP synthase protein I|uniref:ATP synthase protein I n=1 Tax=[Anoxybacillus] calidus TaxID=575178 RepID=A0A7V9YZK6_9BACL|nr:ATP synthase subunit I [Anoxybacillus calidus]MBA2871183.1 ATP synthase protein I [Anoxybacillus calidus]